MSNIVSNGDFVGINRSLADERFLSSIGDGVIVVNEYGTITQVNQTALALLGYRKDEIEGSWLPKTLPSLDKFGQDVATYDRPILRALLSGRPVSEISTFIKKDGSTFPVAQTASPFTVDGTPLGGIIVFRDFTRELQIERAKDEFISLTSHQLRSPLTSIRMFTELLQSTDESALSPQQKDYLDKIKLSADHMLELVSNFLSISKLELGRMEVKNSPTDIVKLINFLIEELKPLLQEKHIKLTFKNPAKLERINIDASLLSQALHNLITNSIRYACADKPVIKITLSCDQEECILSVADNGIGIPDDAKDRMFERFYRAENARDAIDSGTGLGLYLVKKIAEAMGGRVWFESTENVGTTFFMAFRK